MERMTRFDPSTCRSCESAWIQCGFHVEGIHQDVYDMLRSMADGITGNGSKTGRFSICKTAVTRQ